MYLRKNREQAQANMRKVGGYLSARNSVAKYSHELWGVDKENSIKYN